MVFAIIIVAVVLISIGIAAFIDRDPCPKLILGYSSCNKWFGRECNHSDAELAAARHAMRFSKKEW